MSSAGDARKRGDGLEGRPIEQVLREDRLRHVICDRVATVEQGTSLRDALDLLRDPASRGAVVVVRSPGDGSGGSRGAEVVGIFTERDYLDKIARNGAACDGPIDDLMTADPQVLSPDETIDVAIRWMTRGGYRHLPVVDAEGRLVGLVSTTHIVQYLAEFFPVEVYNLPPRLHQDRAINTREGG